MLILIFIVGFPFCFHRLERKEQEILGDLLRELQDEKDKCKLLETKVSTVFSFGSPLLFYL